MPPPIRVRPVPHYPHPLTTFSQLQKFVSARYNTTSKNNRRYHMGEVKKDAVLVTKLGDYWLTQAEARAVALALGESKYITIEGSMISTFSIDGIVTAEQYKLAAKQRGRSWKCAHGGVHVGNDPCRCSIQLAPPRQPVGYIEMSPEAKLEADARSQALREYMRKNLKDPVALKDREAREKFVTKRVTVILAEQAQTTLDVPSPAESHENSSDKKEAHTEPQNASK